MLILPKTKNSITLLKEAIEEAMDYLDISQTVRIKFSNGQRRTGCYRQKHLNGAPVSIGDNPSEWIHSITISKLLSSAEISATLWHELTHASQAERFNCLDDLNSTYRLEQRINGYKFNLLEEEARMRAKAHLWLLVEDPCIKKVNRQKDASKKASSFASHIAHWYNCKSFS
jgi:hypothetical protein